MDISVDNLQKKIKLNSAAIELITRRILKETKVKRAIITVVFVADQKIRALNKKFLKRDHVTDVLAFDWKKGNGIPLVGISKKNIRDLYGDIIISTDAVKRNAVLFRSSLPHELVLYVLHGILHLLGFDDHSPADISRMRKKEAQILKKIEKDISKCVAF